MYFDDTALPRPPAPRGFNKGKGKLFGAADIRYVTKGNVLFVTTLGWPASGRLLLKALAAGGPHYPGKVKRVELLGAPGSLKFEHSKEGLSVVLPPQKPNAIPSRSRLYRPSHANPSTRKASRAWYYALPPMHTPSGNLAATLR